MEPILLDLELARRIEHAEARAGAAAAEGLALARPSSGAAVERIAGGYANFAGSGSPITQAVGLGLEGSVSREEFVRLESFYRKRGEPVRAEVCPLADASLFEHFAAGGYRVTEFSNVMVRALPAAGIAANGNEIDVKRAAGTEIDLWNLVVAQGFSENAPANREILEIMKVFAVADGVECYLAKVDGQPAGGGTLSIRDGVAGLFGASTLPAYRNRGVQTALLNARLARAAELGCNLAACLAQPGSSSQRNVVRQGFQTLYTRLKFEKP
jgi:GNAT superfamily N-acetyltransferase